MNRVFQLLFVTYLTVAAVVYFALYITRTSFAVLIKPMTKTFKTQIWSSLK